MAPLPARANSNNPQASDPAMPSAFRMRSLSKRSSFAQATAAPNGPVVPGAWKPRPSLLCWVARPMRIMTSAPVTRAVMSSRPPRPRS
jgi:hypothetical protein